ncbi:hypothetical protein DL768_009590 [Monosporascus sp. mg162]|nr:hypothetical protein DL768_009590 [Monosporascus sp. mg162]
MACPINHTQFFREYPQFTTCPACKQLFVPVVDLTSSPPSSPTSGHPMRPQIAMAISAPAATASHKPLTFAETVQLAKRERTKPLEARSEPKLIFNDVTIVLYVSKEYLINHTPFKIRKIKSITKSQTISALPEAINIFYDNHKAFIKHMFTKWNVEEQYRQETGWEFVGEVRLGNGQGYTVLSLNPSKRVRLQDIKYAGRQDVTKDKFTVNILYRLVLRELDKEEDEIPRKNKGKAKNKLQPKPTSSQSLQQAGTEPSEDYDIVDIATAVRTGNVLGRIPPTKPVAAKSSSPRVKCEVEPLVKTEETSFPTKQEPIKAVTALSELVQACTDTYEAVKA